MSMNRLCMIISIVTIALALTVEINNIHYGYRNIYIGQPVLKQQFTIMNYKLTKQELTSDDIPFVSSSNTQIKIKMSQLVRQFDVEQLDPSAPMLTFRYQQKPSIVVSVFSQNQLQQQNDLILKLSEFGQDQSVLDL